MRRYVVIGNGAAGLSAVRAIREVDRAGSIALVGEEPYPSYSKVLLTHYIAGRLSREDVFLVDEGFERRYGVDVLLGTRAATLDPEESRVDLSDGRSLRYDALLIAAGAYPVLPLAFRRRVDGVIGLRTLDDARRLRNAALSGERVVIVGGGLVGIKLGCALREAGLSPELLVSSSRILSQVADHEAAMIIQQHLSDNGLRLRFGVDVKELAVGPRGLEGLVLTDGSFAPCRLVAVCKGVRPATELVKGLAEVRQGIAVNEGMQTSIPGVYAAGDVAETRDVSTGVRGVRAIWPHAIAEGRVAGINMSGGSAAFPGSLARNALEILGLPFVSMGITSVPPDPEWRCVTRRSRSSYLKLVLRQDEIVGAVLLGSVRMAGRVQAAIRKGDKQWRDRIPI